MVWIKALLWLLLSNLLVTGGMVLMVYLAAEILSACCAISVAALPIVYLALTIFCFGLFSALFSWLLMPQVVKHSLALQPLMATEREAFAKKIASNLAQRLGMREPELYSFAGTGPNALVLSLGRQRAWLLFSSSLLQSASDAELRAVVAHEMAHIYSGDMLSMQLLQGTTIVFAFAFAQVLATLFHAQQPMRALLILVLQALFFLFSLLPIAWFSRRREYAADRFAAEQYGVAGMLSLLRTHAAVPAHDACCGPLAPLATFGETRGFFASHPMVEQRIAALQKLE
ncbi:M48 family metalloprotease [Acidithiobacillus sp. IBUN Pt1247-S3]|uniref:M48 family metalloprotease n=1 Tax=Acidithiobacillus sp. IBUN Pt1247-S3 TaxID=3166642 RepID=UPI0034E3DD56